MNADILYRTAEEMAAYGRSAGWYIFSGDEQAPTVTGPFKSKDDAEASLRGGVA